MRKVCKHADVKPDAAGRLTMRKDGAYRCLVPLPDLSKMLPASVTEAYSYREPTPGNTFKHWCEKCPLHEERE